MLPRRISKELVAWIELRNAIVVNNGHRDFVLAMRNRALQLRYLVRLYVDGDPDRLTWVFSGLSAGRSFVASG